MNERVLRFRDLRVIGPEGEQIGIVQSRQALTMARDQGLDLVLVSPTANPPVAKIIDYGRFKYMTEKQAKEGKRKQQDVKGIKISPVIAEHDLAFQTKKADEFLREGHKVKVTCQFKSRQVTHPELGRQRLDKMADQLKDLAIVDRIPSMEGRLMIMVLSPKPQVQPKKQANAKTEDKQDGGQAIQSDGLREDHATPVAQ
ncbi:MAG TPA: translation initiation factor IF-3 [Fimbriimonadaceae bacterium]